MLALGHDVLALVYKLVLVVCVLAVEVHNLAQKQ